MKLSECGNRGIRGFCGDRGRYNLCEICCEITGVCGNRGDRGRYIQSIKNML